MTALAGLDAIITQVADRPRTLAQLGRALMAQGNATRARELCARALAQAPMDGEVCSIVAEIMSCGVPDWHFPMLHDRARNAAYEAALRRAVRPETRVLEIGAGSGLLAMMAARAGAREVITCEQHEAIAETAREIIARNAFADRVRVVAKHSSDIDVAADLGGTADMLVCEIFSNDLVGEVALPAIEQATRRLLRPGARVIPASGTVRVALAEDLEFERRALVTIAGFDLSPFNRLRPHRYRIRTDHKKLVLRSDPADLFTFDFQSGGPFPEARTSVVLSAGGGRINGVAQWIQLQMDQDIAYEDSPGSDVQSAWAILFYPLIVPIEPAAGARVTIHGAHDRHSVRAWVD